jgi:DNA-binding IclR family transcriptional regulator
VLVIARAGEHSPQLWALLPAVDDAAGRLLLTFRDEWRHSLEDAQIAPTADSQFSLVRDRGYASVARESAGTGSLAVPVPAEAGPPLAAIAVRGPSSVLTRREASLVELLHHAASLLARHASKPG